MMTSKLLAVTATILLSQPKKKKLRARPSEVDCFDSDPFIFISFLGISFYTLYHYLILKRRVITNYFIYTWSDSTQQEFWSF